MERSGAELVVESLRKEGVDIVFGYPGGQIIPVFDALYGVEDIRLVLTRHEQAAVHAADGYARATGKTGVCIVTSGPGATNTVTGLATARIDSVPLVCIAGQVPRNMLGNDAFQEADTVGITQPVTKHNYLVTSREKLGETLKKAFHLARTGRPGPVVVDLPKDVQTAKTDDEYPEAVSIRGYQPVLRPRPEGIRETARILAEARKPLFFAGGGVHIAEAQADLAKLAEKAGIPVVVSLMGIGALPGSHPLNLGMIGMHGGVIANKAVTSCDVLVGLGVRFDDRATGAVSRFAPGAKIVHADIDPSSIGRNVRVDVPVVGDLRETLRDLEPLLEPRDLSAWTAEIDSYRELEARLSRKAEAKTVDGFPSPKEALHAVAEAFPDAVFATEVGQHQMWAAQYLPFSRPRSWLTSGGLGTMGYGFPAALGAQAGRPGERVVVIAGDGSFQMNIQELATCVQEGLPVVVVILNNGYLGMVRQWQELFFRRRYSSTCLRSRRNCEIGCNSPGRSCPAYSPDFAGIARAYGAGGFTARSPQELTAALEAASRERGPAVIDCFIEREANVWPIVPPGKGNDEMVYEGEQV